MHLKELLLFVLEIQDSGFERLFMKKHIVFFLMIALFFPGCTKSIKSSEIVIVYTNDVHTYIANSVKKDDETVPALRFSKIAKMVKDLKAQGKEVLLVDAGDEIQGSSYGGIDDGEGIISLMNATGYDLATFGNHEFDYGTEQFYKVISKADYPYISCNFHYTGTDKRIKDFSPYKIFEIAGKKVAFIGISTTDTITSSTPANFQDNKGNYIYAIDGLEKPEDLYSSVQNQIDEVKSKADYIIALGHVGVSVDEIKNRVSSKDIIQNTAGLNAFIGGHSHSAFEGEMIADREGKDVLSTQTGAYLSAAGVMTISKEGKISSKFVYDYDSCDESVEKAENEVIGKVQTLLGKKIAFLDTTLTVNSPENEKQRLIRAQELNLGDFTADSVYWFFNEAKKMNCDAAFINGGGIRASIKNGEVTLNDVKNVQPFGNVICLIKATGQQILDSLEMGTTVIGGWDYEWNAPAENPGFLHAAGLKYSVDPSIKSSVKLDDKGMFCSVQGKYRVQNVQIYNRDLQKYEPLDLNRTYTVGGINYLLRNGGNGLSMFQNCSVVIDFIGMDFEVMAEYMKNFTVKEEFPEICTKNSPLCTYKNYLLDYENPYGSGRIEIKKN